MSVTAPGAAMTSGSVPTSPTRTKDVPGARRRPPFGGLEERGGRRKDASVAVGVGHRRAVHAEDPLGPASGHHGTLPGDAVKTCAVADCLSGRRTFSRRTFCPADRARVQ